MKIRDYENKQPHTVFLLKKFPLQFVVEAFFLLLEFYGNIQKLIFRLVIFHATIDVRIVNGK